MDDRFKFRVWDKEDCSYFEPRDFDDLWLNENAELRVGFYSDATQMIEDYTDNVIIEQCTGLKDKNGNLIYENDLIIAPNNSHKLAVIRMENGVYGCKEYRFNGVWEMNLYDLIKHYGVEIIGNIHETKENKDGL